MPRAAAKPSTIPIADAFAAWKGDPDNGVLGVSIGALATQYGVQRKALYVPFVQLAGGTAQYHELREKGAGGGKQVNTGGLAVARAARAERVSAGLPAVDDSAAKRIPAGQARLADGWNIKTVWFGDERTSVLIHVDTGKRYFRASAHERADVIIEHRYGMQPARWRAEEASGEVKRAKKEDALVEQGEAARAAKKQTKAQQDAAVQARAEQDAADKRATEAAEKAAVPKSKKKAGRAPVRGSKKSTPRRSRKS